MEVWLLALLPLLLTQSTHAQAGESPGTGVLTGSAYDAHHHPVAAAKIILQQNGTILVTVETDHAGLYRATIPAGRYTVRGHSDKQGEAFAGPLTVSPSKIATLDLILQPDASSQPKFFDQPSFTVAGVTDNTYRGGHGSDTVLRSAETLTKATALLSTTSPNDKVTDPHRAQGQIEEQAGHPLEAVEEFQRAAELHPTEANLFDWGSELLAHRAPKPAADVFTKGAQLFPQSLRMLLGLATAWYSVGAYERAAPLFFQASDLDPGDPNPYLFLSQVKAREITQLPEYQERLARFARLQPGNALACYHYAVCLWEQHKGPEDNESSDRAYSLLEAALAIDPHLGPAYLQRGIIEAAQGKYAEAIRSYQQAIESSPNLEEAHYRLSEAYKITGDRTRATEELARYNQLSKQSAETVERERQQILQFVIALRSQRPTPPGK